MNTSSPPERSVTLSTGETVALPLRTEATVVGAAFGASRARAKELLPDGLSPLPTRPGRTAVTFLCAEYREVGGGAVDPYGEFGVVVPVAPGLGRSPSLGAAPARGVGGYVWYLPVTTDAGRALGEEIWGYPKVVADVQFEDAGSWRRTVVTVDGDPLIGIDVRRPPAVPLSGRAYGYTERAGSLLREPIDLSGELGAWPFSAAARYELGTHPRAGALRRLDLGDRCWLRFSADGEFVIGEGVPVARA